MDKKTSNANSTKKRKVSPSDPSASSQTNDPRPFRSGKREQYLAWDDYFMAVAWLSAQRSKDPETQVGACIVNSDNRIVGVGYNNMPKGCDDDKMPWGTKEKSKYVIHAERNAVRNTFSADIKGCTMYVTLFPCDECAEVIIQSGITKIYYYSDHKMHKRKYREAKEMLDHAGIKCVMYRPKEKIVIFKDLKDPEETSV